MAALWLNNERETRRGRWAPDEHTEALRAAFDVEMQYLVKSGQESGSLAPEDVENWGVSVEDVRASVSPLASQVIRHNIGNLT